MGASIIIGFELIDKMIFSLWLKHELVDSLDNLAATHLVVEALYLAKMIELDGR